MAQDGLQVVRPVSPPLPSYSLFVPTNLCFFFSSTMVVAESGILVSNRFVALFQRAAGGGGTGYSIILMYTYAQCGSSRVEEEEEEEEERKTQCHTWN